MHCHRGRCGALLQASAMVSRSETIKVTSVASVFIFFTFCSWLLNTSPSCAMLTTAIYHGPLSWCWTELAFSLIMMVNSPGFRHGFRWTPQEFQTHPVPDELGGWNWTSQSSTWLECEAPNISTCLPAVSLCLAYLHVDMVQFSSCWLHLCLWPCSFSDRSHGHASGIATIHPENWSSHKNRLSKTCPLGSIPWPFTFRAACLINQMVIEFH